MFDSDKHIDDFLKSENDFSIPISETNHKENCLYIEQIPEVEMTYSADINHYENPFEAEIIDNADQEHLEVLQCKNDKIPRGLTPLEHLFYFNDVAKEPRMESMETNVEEHNIGSLAEPTMIKLSSTLPAHIKIRYIELFKEFKYVSAWGYKELKSYGTRIIQHKIPLK